VRPFCVVGIFGAASSRATSRTPNRGGPIDPSLAISLRAELGLVLLLVLAGQAAISGADALRWRSRPGSGSWKGSGNRRRLSAETMPSDSGLAPDAVAGYRHTILLIPLCGIKKRILRSGKRW
jgi:hypothetical protein